jgi:Fe-S-cluster containining protein
MPSIFFLRKKPLLEELALRALRLYRAVDAETACFSGKSGLKCPPGCGHCCEYDKITSSVLEFLPFACEAWKRGKAEEWIGRIHTLLTPSKCVFYEEFSLGEGKGHCLIYEWRPLVCRLFGFSSVRDKMGGHIYAACTVFKKEYPEKVKKAMKLLNSRSAAPVLMKFNGTLWGIDPGLSNEQFPLAAAALIALEKVGLTGSFTGKTKIPC